MALTWLARTSEGCTVGDYLSTSFSGGTATPSSPAPAAIGFVGGRGLGPQYQGDLFVGAARTTLAGGYLFRFKLSPTRASFRVDDPRLADRVADNHAKFDLTESESLLIGRDFGIGTDIEEGPSGTLFVVSLSNGAVYEIYPRHP
jgi:glucose/arabinose dehydrogenase